MLEVGYYFGDGSKEKGLNIEKETDKAVYVIVAHGGSYPCKVWLPKSQIKTKITNREITFNGKTLKWQNAKVTHVEEWLVRKTLKPYINCSIYAEVENNE